jgi:hypothetical protein
VKEEESFLGWHPRPFFWQNASLAFRIAFVCCSRKIKNNSTLFREQVRAYLKTHHAIHILKLKFRHRSSRVTLTTNHLIFGGLWRFNSVDSTESGRTRYSFSDMLNQNLINRESVEFIFCWFNFLLNWIMLKSTHYLALTHNVCIFENAAWRW